MTTKGKHVRIDTEPNTITINAQNRDQVKEFIKTHTKDKGSQTMENRETVTAFNIARNYASKHQDELDEVKKIAMNYRDPIRGKVLFLIAYIEELEEKIAVVELGDE